MSESETPSGTPVRAASGKVVGRVAGDIFHKTVREREHMLHAPLGWACDVCTLEQAQAAGANFVQLEASDTGRTYLARLSLFWTKKAIPLDRGFGRQRALPLAFWQMSGPGQPAARQLSLFEAVSP